MSSKSVLIVILLASLMAGCNLSSLSASPTPIPSDIPTLEFIQPTSPPVSPPTSTPTAGSSSPSTIPLSADQVVLQRAAQVVAALKVKDMSTVSNFVHSDMALRFSPYAFIRDSDQLFSADQVANLLSDSTIYTWGVYDGSGESIDLTFTDYYSKFIYDEDFTNAPQVALNHRLGMGNSLDNSMEFYPGAMVVEYYFPGFDPAYEGMDWRSLRLVFIQENNTWYLVGIIHDQWTT